MRKCVTFAIMLLSLLFIFTSCGGDGEEELVYATSIDFNSSGIVITVGDEIEMKSSYLTIQPTNCTIEPEILIEDANILLVNGTTITAIAEGTVQITASVADSSNSVKTAIMSVTVLAEQVYAESITVDKSVLEINLGETIINNLNIFPQDTTVTPEVIIENTQIAEYNYVTGLVVSKAAGETTVTVKIKKNGSEYIEDYFTVEVTNYTYATNLQINPSQNLTLFTNETYNVDCLVTPQSYNMGILIENEHTEYFTVTSSGALVTNSLECESLSVQVKVKSSKTEFITKTINVTIKSPVTEIGYKIYKEETEISSAFVTNAETYVLKTLQGVVVASTSNYSATELEVAGEYEIVFHTAGNIYLSGYYENVGTFSNFKVYFPSESFVVHNCINEINISVCNNETEIFPVSGKYNLHMFDAAYKTEAENDNIFNNAHIYFSAAGTNVKEGVLALQIESGDSISLVNNKATAVKEGKTVMSVISSDPQAHKITFTINVSSVLAEDILNVPSNLTLYLNSSSEVYPNCYTFSSSVSPVYAMNNEVNYSVNNANITLKNGVITAVSAGKAKVVVSAGEIEKTVNVTIKLYPTSLLVTLNESEINQGVEVFIGEATLFVVEVYSGNILITEATFSYSFYSLETGDSIINPELIEEDFEEKASWVSLTFTTIGRFGLKFISQINGNIYKEIEVNVIAFTNPTTPPEENGGEEDPYKNYIPLSTLDELMNINTQNNYKLVSDILITNSFTTINEFYGSIYGNGYNIIGLNTMLFNKLHSSSSLINLSFIQVLINETSLTNFAIIAQENNGVIDGVSISGVLTMCGYETESSSTAGVVFENYGTIKNCKVQLSFYNEREGGSTWSSAMVAGLAFVNCGSIEDTEISITTNGFSLTAGAVYENCGNIENTTAATMVTAEQTYSKRAAGFVFYIGGKNSQIINCSSELYYTGNMNIRIAGFIFEISSERCEESLFNSCRATVAIYEDSVTQTQIGWFAHTVNAEDAIFENCHWEKHEQNCNENGLAVWANYGADVSGIAEK